MRRIQRSVGRYLKVVSILGSVGEGHQHTPPSCHKCKQPLARRWQIFEKDGSIQDQVTSSAESTETYKKSKDLPVRTRSCHNSEDEADNERDIECSLPSNDIGTDAPEKRANEHTDIGGNGESIRISRVEFESGLTGNDGLDQEDERVDGVAEAVEYEELPDQGQQKLYVAVLYCITIGRL
jgi:hypothetical protein